MELVVLIFVATTSLISSRSWASRLWPRLSLITRTLLAGKRKMLGVDPWILELWSTETNCFHCQLWSHSILLSYHTWSGWLAFPGVREACRSVSSESMYSSDDMVVTPALVAKESFPNNLGFLNSSFSIYLLISQVPLIWFSDWSYLVIVPGWSSFRFRGFLI